jgi:hypothetical protein
MTMDELNALYNNMSVYGDTYTSPTTTIPTDPNAGQPPILEPLIPALPMQYINQGGDNDKGGITSIAPATYEQTYDPNLNFAEFTSGVKGTPSFTQEYTKRPGVGIQSLFELLQKISPMANIMKLGKTGIETAQKYFADKKETERLEALAQIEQARKQKEAQATIAAAEEKSKQIAANRIQAANEQNRTGGYQAGYGSDFMGGGDRGTGMGAADKGGSDSMGSFARGGRTGYGKGGIVTL